MSGDVHVWFCESPWVRFLRATHLVVLARYQSERLQASVEGFIEGRMGLTINREKTRIVKLREKGASLDFLGFTFRYDRDLSGRDHRYLNVVPSKKSVAREKQRIRELTDHHHCFQPLSRMIATINRQTMGWKKLLQLRVSSKGDA